MTSGELVVSFDNDADPECTVLTVEGKDRSDLLMSLTGALTASDVAVVSASITSDDGRVLDVFRCTTLDGNKIPKDRWEGLRSTIMALTTTSSRSGMPAIYGVVAAAEAERLRRPGSAQAQAGADEAAVTANEAAALELAAAELAQAAANIVAIERDLATMLAKAAKAADSGGDGAAAATSSFDPAAYDAREAERAEAAAVLERRMAAMEAALAARRTSPLLEVLRIPAAAQAEAAPVARPDGAGQKESLQDQLRRQLEAPAPPPPPTGPAAGTGYEILLQGFNWESHKGKGWYREVASRAEEWANAGFTAVWLPPPSDAVSPQGYLPRDLYDLNSCYGTEAELRDCITALHDVGIKVLADIVINHRCATYQSPDGKWNRFGGRLAWDQRAICNNNPAWGGRGNHKTGDDYPAAPNIDHTQEFVRNDVIDWLNYLRRSIGYDGWRFDYVRGYSGNYAKIYIDATTPEMAIGEYWDACGYTDGVLDYGQDPHRQRTINWLDATGGTCAAFDFTSKGILQEALGRNELWRLVDAQGRPPGVMGLWPSRAVTFLDNHDTGSTLNHWPFPNQHLAEGYAYILTHPGTPTVFYDHLYTDANGLRKAILDLLALRKRQRLSCRSTVIIRKAAADVYAATLDDRVAMKIGRGDWSPEKGKVDPPQGKRWKLSLSGNGWAVWEAE